MKHVKPEHPLEKADRLIGELATPEWFGNFPRHHATDNRHQERLELMDEFYSMPMRWTAIPRIECDPCRQDLWDRNMTVIRWEIDNPLFAKDYK